MISAIFLIDLNLIGLERCIFFSINDCHHPESVETVLFYIQFHSAE